MIWHSAPVNKLKAELSADDINGLSDKAAEEKLKKHGYNIPAEYKKIPMWQRIKRNLSNIPAVLLIITAVVEIISFIFLKNNNPLVTDGSILTPILIIIFVAIDTALSIFEEIKTEKQSFASKKSVIPCAKVIRNGRETVISADKIVPGDTIIVESGDIVPADARLTECNSLRCDESSVTGENITMQKAAEIELEDIIPLSQRRNMIYYGSTISSGSGKAIVCETGKFTEYSKLIRLGDCEDSDTVIQTKMSKICNILSVIVIAASALIFILGIFLSDARFFNRVVEIFPIAVAAAAASVPQSIIGIVSAVLSLGISRMASKKAVVHKSACIETLGEISVIIADKTGTLTKNELEVKSVYDGISLENPAEKLTNNSKQMLIMAALCSDGDVITNEDGSKKIIGDPTEAGIVSAASRYCGITKESIDANCPRVYEIPFDSERKIHTTVNIINSNPIVISKGSADKILEKCRPCNTAEILSKINEMERDAMRVLAVAIKKIPEVPVNPDDSQIESELTFIGLIGLKDKPIKELKNVLSACRRGGISTVMITGDPLTSARKAAEELGILYGDKVALNGEHLAALSDDELCEIVERIAVYSRISPEDKLRIVRAWQKKGHIVAVTGDFHGDAEALKAADVGYAMGKKGSDIARESADITLADDSFTTIASSVAYGRNAFNNIRRVMQYLIGTNLGELFTIIFGLIIFKRSPLSVLPLLWMNIITDSLPAICLGLEPPAYDILARPPVKTYDTVFGKKFMLLTSFTGILVAALSLTAYSIGSRTSAEAGRAMVFGVITFAELAVCLCMRSRHSLFDRKMPKNNLLILTVVSSVLLTAAILLITPVGIAFGTASMSFIQWAWVMGLSLIPIVFFEIGKFFLSFKKAR